MPKFLLDFLSQPFVKTTGAALTGILTMYVMSAIAHPTGGMATAMTHNPVYAMAFTTAAMYFHNLISKWTFIQNSQVAAVVAAATAAPASAVSKVQ